METKPVRPRDAASLILLRERSTGLEVLLGRRGKDARFMPGRYVFPGGRVTAEDARRWAGEIADPAAEHYLDTVRDDPDPDVRKNVRWALGRLR